MQVSGIRQEGGVSGISVEGTYCPDCDTMIVGDREAFIAHREAEHVGKARILAASGIRSQEAHGYQDPPPSEEE